MSKKILVILIGLFLLIGLAGVNGVSPHPDYLKEIQLRGDGPMLTQKLDEMRKAGMDAPQKAFPTTGTNKVLVIMIEFPDTTTAMLEKKENPFKYASLGILGIILLGIIITFIFGRKKGITGIILPVLIVFVLPTFILVNSCFIFETSDPSSPEEETYPAEALSFNGVSTPTFYSNLLNGITPSALSMKKYYSDMSNGTLTLDLTVVGPYTSNYSYIYYGRNNGLNDRKPGTLVGEAIDAAEADGIDFSEYANGETEMSIIIIHSGKGEETGADSDYIWSHRWSLNSAEYYGDGSGARTYDGVTINDYAIQSEYVNNPGDTKIGLFCHEFGHILGLPDLYDTGLTTKGVGDWSLMSSGSWNGANGSLPAPLTAWEREKIGWITPTTVTSGTGPHTVKDILDSDSLSVAYKIDSTYSYNGESQYYLIENIYNDTGGTSWVDGLPGTGLLITLIDEYIIDKIPNNSTTGTLNNNRVNALTSPFIHGVTVIEAEGVSDLWTGNEGEANDLFDSAWSPLDLYRNNYTGSTTGTKLSEDTGFNLTTSNSPSASMQFNF